MCSGKGVLELHSDDFGWAGYDTYMKERDLVMSEQKSKQHNLVYCNQNLEREERALRWRRLLKPGRMYCSQFRSRIASMSILKDEHTLRDRIPPLHDLKKGLFCYNEKGAVVD